VRQTNSALQHTCRTLLYDRSEQYCCRGCARQCTATHCNTLQHTVAHCDTLQHTHSTLLQDRVVQDNALQHTATNENTLQRLATHCNTLKHIAALRDTLQHAFIENCNTTGRRTVVAGVAQGVQSGHLRCLW